MSNPSEEFMILTNLQQVRFIRPWIDSEFMLYQKLCRNREAILDLHLEQIKAAHSKIKKEQRDAARRSNSKTL